MTRTERILQGTESMKRYSWVENLFGVEIYGSRKATNGTAYKIGKEDVKKAERAGWFVVHYGSSYAYVMNNSNLGFTKIQVTL